MDRDGWKCVKCGTEEEQLHVHHKKYTEGAMAWEYPDHLLETRCHKCHKALHLLDSAPGIVVTWAWVFQNQPECVWAAPWTGETITRGPDSEMDDEYICLSPEKEKIGIPVHAGMFFVRPPEVDMQQVESWAKSCAQIMMLKVWGVEVES